MEGSHYVRIEELDRFTLGTLVGSIEEKITTAARHVFRCSEEDLRTWIGATLIGVVPQPEFNVEEMPNLPREAKSKNNKRPKALVDNQPRNEKTSQKYKRGGSAKNQVDWKTKLAKRVATPTELSQMTAVQRYWYRMTPAERSKEGARRRNKAA